MIEVRVATDDDVALVEELTTWLRQQGLLVKPRTRGLQYHGQLRGRLLFTHRVLEPLHTISRGVLICEQQTDHTRVYGEVAQWRWLAILLGAGCLWAAGVVPLAWGQWSLQAWISLALGPGLALGLFLLSRALAHGQLRRGILRLGGGAPADTRPGR
jgi:hypothetical protein